MNLTYKDLKTEKPNPKSKNIDIMPISDILNLFYEEDLHVIKAVKDEHKNIELAIEIVHKAIELNGKIFYVGAGTSGRLGVLDASEIKPTFGIKKKIFIGIIAGGKKALSNSIEGAEDDGEQAIKELKKYKFGINKNDVLIGITASGMTPFVLSALNYAKDDGCATILITCNKNVAKQYEKDFNVIISPDVGSEIILGSTRLKSGTATKMILNMISTISMIKYGKVYKNYMVDLIPSCKKLVDRAIRILSEICSLNFKDAEKILKSADYNLKVAILMHKKNISKFKAKAILKKCNGHLRIALKYKNNNVM